MKYTYKIIKLFNGEYGILRSDEQPYVFSFRSYKDAVNIKKQLEDAQ